MFIIDVIRYIPYPIWILLVCIISVELIAIEYLARQFKVDIHKKRGLYKFEQFQSEYLESCGGSNADCSPKDISKIAKKYGLTEYETYLAVRQALDPRFQKKS